MKIFAIGYFYEHDFVDCGNFSSSTSFLDYDMIVIDFRYILDEYTSALNGTYLGHKSLSDNDSARLLEDIERRKMEIAEMLKLGRSIIVYTPYDTICYVDTGKRDYSGTGKNARTTRIVEDVNLLSILPTKIKMVKASGANIEFRGDESFAAFWKQNSKYLSFDAYFKENIGKPLFFIKGTDKAVGSYMNIDNGNLLIIPGFIDDGDDDKKEYEFFKSLQKLVNEIKKSTGDFELPSWSKEYILPDEVKQKENIKKYENELKNLNNKISKQKKLIAKLEEHKILFTGDGKALEVQVGKVFNELGFQVSEGLPGRDDLILKFEDRVAVVEVKGVSKSAAEKHAAQLEKWVSNYYMLHEVEAKGILVINAYKNIPLKERTEDAYPNQMINYSEKRNHCLMTGIQLLNMYLYCTKNPERTKEVVNRIFDMSGLFTEFNDWTTFLDCKDKENIVEIKAPSSMARL